MTRESGRGLYRNMKGPVLRENERPLPVALNIYSSSKDHRRNAVAFLLVCQLTAA